MVGSVNLYLQGVNVTPKKDIDLATDYETVQTLKAVFENNVTEYCSDQNGDDFLPFSYLFIRIDDYEIEFFDALTYGASYYFGEVSIDRSVVIPTINVNALNLQTELLVYKKSGKAEKIKAIEEKLNSITAS